MSFCRLAYLHWMVNITSNIPTSSAALSGGSTHAPYGRVKSNTNRNINPTEMVGEQVFLKSLLQSVLK